MPAETRNIPFTALGGVFEQDDIDAALKVMQAAAAPGGGARMVVRLPGSRATPPG